MYTKTHEWTRQTHASNVHTAQSYTVHTYTCGLKSMLFYIRLNAEVQGKSFTPSAGSTRHIKMHR